MKTTNLEISKKLKEIGFKKESLYLWGEYNINENETKFELRLTNKAENLLTANTFYPAYDFETIWENLPNAFENGKKFAKKKLFYDFGFKIGYFEHNIFIYQEIGESLADTAGRLIIKLHKEGLISFGGENE
jgi:hypothetical protein